MMCPVCDIELKITDRQGVEIDYCPKCRGVWLDRGELDKLIERSLSLERPRQSEDDHNRGYRDDDDYEYHKHRKRKSFLGELFDF